MLSLTDCSSVFCGGDESRLDAYFRRTKKVLWNEPFILDIGGGGRESRPLLGAIGHVPSLLFLWFEFLPPLLDGLDGVKALKCWIELKFRCTWRHGVHGKGSDDGNASSWDRYERR